MRNTTYMNIAIVTTCLNEGDSITQWIADIDNQSAAPNEVVVVDAGSTDGTYEALQSWRSDRFQVRVISLPKCSVAQGRNAAIRATDAEIIASTDMGCRLDPIWFEKIVEPLRADPAIEVVAGNYSADLASLQSAVAWADYYYYGKFEKIMKEGMLPGSRSIAYRRKIWEELGAYPEDLRYAADDTVFALQIRKANYRVVLAPEAISRWRRHKQWSSYRREAFLYGRGNGEAGLPLPRSPKCDWSKFWFPVAAFHGALRLIGRHSWTNAAKAIADGKPWIAPLVPLLSVTKAFHMTKGYAEGIKWGEIHCKACRERLKPHSNH